MKPDEIRKKGVGSMRDKSHKILCVLVALCVLVSGMYFDKFEIDSIFACPPIEKSDSKILSFDTVIAGEQSCNTEMLNVNRIGEREWLTLRGTYQRRDTKISNDFLLINFLSLNGRDFYVSLEEIQLVSFNQKELVISYIHRTDGKKRNSCNS